jgi:hypothetical protein
LKAKELSEALQEISQALTTGKALTLEGFRVLTSAAVMLEVQATEIEYLTKAQEKQ